MSTLTKRSTRFALWGIALAVVATVASVGTHISPAKGAEIAPAAPPALPGVQALSDTFASVSERTLPAVVFIEVQKEARGFPAAYDGNGPGDQNPQDFFRRFFFGPGMGEGNMPERGPSRQGPVSVGQGSGFIISPDGYIATNNHVVGEADRLKVTLSDGRVFDAKIVGSDPQTEVALIKIDAKDLPSLPLANSDNVRVGEWVLAIGNPFGLSHSVTSGIISARGRSNVGIVEYADFIQTDAAINPGNSGGPLINMRGEVVGMNTAILSRTGANNGIGLAVPANMVKYIVDQIRDHGSISRGYLGIAIQPLTPELAKYFGTDSGHGIVVSDVSKGSPAEKAGLQRDDVITEIDGQPIDEGGAFRSRISTTAPGQSITLTVIRDGQKSKKQVEVGKLPNARSAGGASKPGAQESVDTDLGITVQGLTDDLAKRLGFEGETGVVIAEVEPNSQAAAAGLRPGMLVKAVNRKSTANPQEFEKAVNATEKGRATLLLVRDGEMTRYVELKAS